ncbi:MAG: hypothetical protein ACFE9D_10335 [Promethearchaeota archaeon]
MSKSTQQSRQKKKTPSRRKVEVETPEDLPEAISWLHKVLATSYSMNEEGIIRLKKQFDQLYDDHIEEFDRKLTNSDLKNKDIFHECLAAKEILGHLLAVCKYLERILDTKQLPADSKTEQRGSGDLTSILQRDLTAELRTFSQRLEQSQSLLTN